VLRNPAPPGTIDPEKFAGLVRSANLAAEAKERIAEIGLAQYTREQQELRKLMRVLNAVHAESPPDIREQLDQIVDKLKQDPPKNVTEACERIEKFIAATRNDAPNQLRERMQALFRRIKDMMERPDDEVERLEKLRRPERLVRAMIG
jgi:type I site-specific restriction endonuclease